MLSDKLINKALNNNQELEHKKLKLFAIVDTPLDSLCRSTKITDDEPDTPVTNLNEISVHANLMNELSLQLSELVSKHISIVRSVVKPKVLEFSEDIANFKSSLDVEDLVSSIDIEINRLPSILKNPSFLNTLDFYQDKAPSTPNLTLDLEDVDAEVVSSYLVQGSTKINNLVLELVTDLGEDVVCYLYKKYFTNETVTSTFPTMENLNVYDRVKYGTVIYILSMHLLEHVQKTVSPMKLAEYENRCIDIRDYAGSLILVSLRRIDLIERTNQLILKNVRGKGLEVSGVVYDAWQKNGGTPEVLLGVYVTDDNPTTTTSIDKSSDRYANVWKSYQLYQNGLTESKLYEYVVDYVRNMFSKGMEDLTDIEQSYLSRHPNYVESVIENVNKTLNSLTKDEVMDENLLALILIGKVRYHFTPAYDILSSINVAYKSNPNINVNEAALLATVEYVTDYVTDQCRVESVG